MRYSTKFAKVLTLLCICITHNVSSITTNADAELNSLLVNIRSLQADFMQNVYSVDAKLMHSYNGNMEIKKPNSFRWEVQNPDPSLVVTNGDLLWNYDKDLEQVTIQKYSVAEEISPLSFIFGDKIALNENFFVEKTNNTCYKLSPKKETSFEHVEVCFNNKILSKVKILDHMGQNTDFVFSKVQTNHKIADGRFIFVPPKGVDVIGE